MTKQKTGGLGRGLGSILPDIEDLGKPLTESVNTIRVDAIDANPYQPRKDFDKEALEELAQSIRQQGVITPVTVRLMPDGRYQLIAGERRTRAAKLAGLKEIPAYIRTATDTQMMEMALVENIQREDLNAIEVAKAYQQLIEECKLTHDQLSEKVGKERSTISNYLRLLNLPIETQNALENGQISMAHARVLVGIEDIDRHLEILHLIIERRLSVHQVEELAKSAKPKPKVQVRSKGALPERYIYAQQILKTRLQSTVEIKRSQRGKGTLTIGFNSDSDFERILALLNS